MLQNVTGWAGHANVTHLGFQILQTKKTAASCKKGNPSESTTELYCNWYLKDFHTLIQLCVQTLPWDKAPQRRCRHAGITGSSVPRSVSIVPSTKEKQKILHIKNTMQWNVIQKTNQPKNPTQIMSTTPLDWVLMLLLQKSHALVSNSRNLLYQKLLTGLHAGSLTSTYLIVWGCLKSIDKISQ